MATKILNCAKCKHRFPLEHHGSLPEHISCPECGFAGGQADFSALIICQKCRAKLSLPLDIIYDDDNVCPRCGQDLDPETLFSEEKLESAASGGDDDVPAAPKRLLKDGDFFDKYRTIAEYRGIQCDVKYAEGFRMAYDAYRVAPRRVLP